MVVACLIGIVMILVVAFVYSCLFVSKKAEREYEQLKRNPQRNEQFRTGERVKK